MRLIQPGSARSSSSAGPSGHRAGVFGADPARGRFARLVCLVVGVIGWVNLAILGRAMLSHNPPQAGFDLQLLLDAARRVAAGGSPYDPTAVANGLQARDLFYSYPPPVAQILVPFSGLPTWLVLTGWCLGAIAGLGAIAALLSRSPIGRPMVAMPALSLDAALLALAAAPYFFPFAVALLFGNVDAWFPLLCGGVMLTLVAGGRAPSRGAAALGGIGLAVAAAVKLHPGTLLVWLATRWSGAVRPRRPAAIAIAAAALTGLAILGLSLLAGGPRPWGEYLDYLRLGGDADLASRVNIGPASQLALLAGDPGLARPLALAWAVVAIVATIVVARVARDPLESVAWAIVASLIVLPVTWYHYPVALLPVALAAWTRSRGMGRSRRVVAWLAASYVVADASIVLPVGLWLAVALLFVAVRLSSPEPSVEPAPEAPAPTSASTR